MHIKNPGQRKNRKDVDRQFTQRRSNGVESQDIWRKEVQVPVISWQPEEKHQRSNQNNPDKKGNIDKVAIMISIEGINPQIYRQENGSEYNQGENRIADKGTEHNGWDIAQGVNDISFWVANPNISPQVFIPKIDDQVLEVFLIAISIEIALVASQKEVRDQI